MFYLHCEPNNVCLPILSLLSGIPGRTIFLCHFLSLVTSLRFVTLVGLYTGAKPAELSLLIYWYNLTINFPITWPLGT